MKTRDLKTAEPARAPGASSPDPPREICIVMLSAIGDAVQVLPVAEALKRSWPECRITWIIQPVPHLLVKDHPAIDEFILFRRRKGMSAWRSYRELRQSLAGRRFDLVLGLQVYMKAGLITLLTPGKIKLGFDRARARDLNWLFTTERIPAHPPQHIQDQYFEFVRHLGVDPEPLSYGIELSDEERVARKAFFSRFEGPVCAVVVGTSKREKNWDPVKYARLLEEIEHRHGFRTILVGGPSPVEREIADVILAESSARPIDTLGNDLRRLVYLLDGSDLAISPDTGPLHISRALGTPVVGLYGYTNPKRSGPYRKFQDLVVDGYARHPDEDYPVSMEYRDGMKRVEVAAVLEKVALAVERYLT